MNPSLRFYSMSSALSAGVFGQTYAATSAEAIAPNRARVEYLVLLTRGEPRMLFGQVDMPFGKLPDELGDISQDAVHEEGRTQACMELLSHLDARALALGRPDVATQAVDLVRIEYRPLIGAWMLGQWRQQISWLAANAKTAQLRRYAEQVSKYGLEVTRVPVTLPTFS